MCQDGGGGGGRDRAAGAEPVVSHAAHLVRIPFLSICRASDSALASSAIANHGQSSVGGPFGKTPACRTTAGSSDVPFVSPHFLHTTPPESPFAFILHANSQLASACHEQIQNRLAAAYPTWLAPAVPLGNE